MSVSDADRAAGRTSPFPGTSRHGALSPLLSASLTEEHIAEALRQSSDNGATLDLTHRNLTDVGEDGAKHLATMGRNGSLDDESSVFRYVAATRCCRNFTIQTTLGLHWGTIVLLHSLLRLPYYPA